MKVRIGIIGTGFARKVQIPAFQLCENVEVISIASASLENAKAAAEEFNVARFTDNWREVIENKEVDLVCISTPPKFHVEQSIAALKNHKHVLCEKPMAMSLSEANLMAEAAKKSGTLALIDHELRFQTGRRKAFEMLHAGEIGKVRHVKYVFRAPHRGDPEIPWNWWSEATEGGGTLGAIGSHVIDSLLWFLSTDISSVFCQLQTHVKHRKDVNDVIKTVTSDDEVNLVFRFADSDFTEDATANVSLSMVEMPDYQHNIEFVGTKGSLKIGYLGDISRTKTGENEWTALPFVADQTVPGIFDSGFPSSFVSFAPLLIQAIQSGSKMLEGAATFADGVKVQRVLDAARESNDLGRITKLNKL